MTQTKYEVANLFPAVEGVGGIYIYILYFHRDGRDIPFYVGQATDLAHRFANHTQLDWHNATFEEPTRIYVAGQVFKRYASSAEYELMELMISLNFILTNEQIDDREAKLANRSRMKLKAAVKDEVNAYLAAGDTPSFNPDDLHQWRQEWVFKPAVGELIDPDLLREVMGNAFSEMLTESERDTHERLVSIYDFKTARSTLNLAPAEVSEGLRQIWNIEANRAQLHPTSIKAVQGIAESLDAGWMNSKDGELSISRCWAPHGRFKTYLEQQKQVRRLQAQLNRARNQGATASEIEELAATVQANEESLEAHKHWLDEKYV